MSKLWHLTLTRATHAPQVTFRSSGGGEVTLTRGKVTVTNIDLGSTLKSSLIRVIRVEERHKPVQGVGSRQDAVLKNVKPLPKPKAEKPALKPVPVVEPPAPVVVAEEEAETKPDAKETAVLASEPIVVAEIETEVKIEADSSETVVTEPAVEEAPVEPVVEEKPKPRKRTTTRKRTTRKKKSDS